MSAIQGVEFAVVLLADAAGLRVLAGRFDVPHPILLLRQVRRDLDLETMLLESGEDDPPESSYNTR